MPTLIALYAAHPFWVWMAAAAVLLALEIVTGSGYLLWPAVAAAAAQTDEARVRVVDVGAVRPQRMGPVAARHDSSDQGQAGEDGDLHRRAKMQRRGHGDDGGGDLASGAEVEITGVVSGACLKVKAA